MDTAKHAPVAPFYAVAALWIAGSLILPLYSASQIALMVLASIVVFLLVSFICKDAKAIGGERAAEKPAEKPKEEPSTGNAELDKLLKDGALAVSEMQRLNAAISDPEISARITRLEQVSRKIFDEVKRDPGKLPQIRKFMDYYLPTTLKILNSYDRMSGAGVSGENIDGTLSRVKAMMGTIVTAFEKQLDSLYGAEALDISTDITVLENMMAREGLTEQELKAETLPRDDGTDIKLEL